MNAQNFTDEVLSLLQNLACGSIEFKQEQHRQIWDFNLYDHGENWPLRLVTRYGGLTLLPSVYWRAEQPVWGYPHISSIGDVCISDREGVEYEPTDTCGVIWWVLAQALVLLRKATSVSQEERELAFANELEAYLRNAGASDVLLAEPLDVTKAVYVEVTEPAKQRTGQKKPVVMGLSQGIKTYSKSRLERVPLIPVSIHQIAGLLGQWTREWYRHFFSTLTSEQQTQITQSKCHGIVLLVQNDFGTASILLYWGTRFRTLPEYRTYVVQRHDHEYLMRRTGGASCKESVMVVGCGAVGSRVVEHLALSGYKNIVVVDKDHFTANNLGRHVLGKRAISKSKVQALADNLQERITGLNITPKYESVQTLFDDPLLTSTSAIVLATGNAVLERDIMRRAYAQKWPALVVSASVEAGGLGGHALAARAGVPGCLDCLYYDPETNSILSSMQGALLAPGQQVTRQITGCGAFTPYSAIDATRTALLAVELVVGNAPGYLRWAGVGKQAQDLGLHVSDTYVLLRQGEISASLSTEAYAKPGCPCCNS